MKDKIKYYLLLLAFLFIMALILWFFHDWIEQYSNSLMVLITFMDFMSEIRIAIPDLDLNNALRLDGNLRNYEIGPFDDVVLDFSRMTNFDPLPMLMAGAIIKRFRYQYHDNTFSISGINGKSYAGTMGFFKYLSESISVGKSPGEATGSSNYIPITPISIRSLQERAFRDGGSIEIGDMIERASARLSRVIDRGNKELHKLLTYLVREILRNTPEHAQADEMWICGQYWPTYQLAEIAIIDEGIGVFQSITRNAAHAKYIHDNRSALKWAIRAGISESFRPAYEFKPHDYDVWKNSGFGLYMVSQICQKLNGSFCIISYGDALLIDNHGVAEKSTSFHGTAIRIRVPTNNISAAQAIIDEIAAQGEVEARTIKNAFKTASMPSKGLMTQLNI